jgi:hypothetical protein
MEKWWALAMLLLLFVGQNASVGSRDGITNPLENKSNTKQDAFIVVIASPGPFARHINAEFGQVTEALQKKQGWWRPQNVGVLIKQLNAGAQGSADAHNQSRTATMPQPRMPTHADLLATSSSSSSSSSSSTILFVLKFHWDYVALAELASSGFGNAAAPPHMVAYVDDLHWYDTTGRDVQHRALVDGVSAVLSTYAYLLRMLYPQLGKSAKKHACGWVPHATTPDFFVPAKPGHQERGRRTRTRQVVVSG